MSNDPTTSDDEKSVHQQCIDTAEVDAALARSESPSGAINEGDARLLAAEVRRLRKLFDDAGQGEHNVLALIDFYQEETMKADAEVLRLREELTCADRRSDVVFARGYKEGRNEALAENLEAVLREEKEQALGWHADQVRMIQVLEAKLADAQSEIDRLREENALLIREHKTAQEHVAKSDALFRLTAAKLARIEALPAQWREDESHRTSDEEPCLSGLDCATYLEDALRDPQPPAAPTPKGEP